MHRSSNGTHWSCGSRPFSLLSSQAKLRHELVSFHENRFPVPEVRHFDCPFSRAGPIRHFLTLYALLVYPAKSRVNLASEQKALKCWKINEKKVREQVNPRLWPDALFSCQLKCIEHCIFCQFESKNGLRGVGKSMEKSEKVFEGYS